MPGDRTDLRRRLRAGRRAIEVSRQTQAATAVAATLQDHLPAIVDAVISAYLATDGELDPSRCVALLGERGGRIVYPRIDGDTMTFHEVGEDDLVDGPVGLTQPMADTPRVAPTDLALVLCPLVGFDDQRNRIGRGRGYYDRSFWFLGSDRPRPSRPVLVGLAHDTQHVDELGAQSHDIRLDAVVTPTRVVGDLAAAIAAAFPPSTPGEERP